MYVKKSISLLLSGALFASLYTGCSQTTMEHHFFTDTVTETEINTEVVENAITPKIEELQEILGDIKLVVDLYAANGSAYDIPGVGPSFDWTDIIINEAQNNGRVSSEKLEALTYLPYVFLCDAEPYENEITLNQYMSGMEKALEDLCVAFRDVGEEKMDWLLEYCDGVLALQVLGLQYSEDGMILYRRKD